MRYSYFAISLMTTLNVLFAVQDYLLKVKNKKMYYILCWCTLLDRQIRKELSGINMSAINFMSAALYGRGFTYSYMK